MHTYSLAVKKISTDMLLLSNQMEWWARAIFLVFALLILLLSFVLIKRPDLFGNNQPPAAVKILTPFIGIIFLAPVFISFNSSTIFFHKRNQMISITSNETGAASGNYPLSDFISAQTYLYRSNTGTQNKLSDQVEKAAILLKFKKFNIEIPGFNNEIDAKRKLIEIKKSAGLISL